MFPFSQDRILGYAKPKAGVVFCISIYQSQIKRQTLKGDFMSEIVEENENAGSVLVVGGGIAGIQSALDLAESGYYVYLLEPSPAIGGRMAQLDKTFPTNDCAMCIISPKLVECGKHRNIEIITYADLLKVEGEPGNFKVKIRKRARSVDDSLCTGCGSCWNNCPVRNKIYLRKEKVIHKE